MYDLTGDQRYRDAIETIRGQLETQPRTKEGNFWHKKIYPNQVWLDGTYMAQPFYMEYETRCNGMHGCIDSYKQFMNIQKHMKDAKTGLYYHGYDESREMYWANPETGCSANFWLRAWLVPGGMVDTLERMDNQLYYEYRAIMAMLKDAVDAMKTSAGDVDGDSRGRRLHPGARPLGRLGQRAAPRELRRGERSGFGHRAGVRPDRQGVLADRDPARPGARRVEAARVRRGHRSRRDPSTVEVVDVEDIPMAIWAMRCASASKPSAI